MRHENISPKSQSSVRLATIQVSRGAVIESIEARLNFLIPKVTNQSLPRWPPDVFCICAALLQASGAYARVLDDDPPQGKTPKLRADRVKKLKRTGLAWRRVAEKQDKALPTVLDTWWGTVLAQKDTPLHALGDNRDCTLAILNLMAAADEASAGLGIFPLDARPSDQYESAAERSLSALWHAIAPDGEGGTLCRKVLPSKGRVLPKMHTPQNGLTIRSMSSHLAYTYSPDVKPEWLSAAIDNKHHCFNLLAVPWPMMVEPRQFERSRVSGISDSLGAHSYGLFTFKSSPGPSVAYVKRLLDEAERLVGKVDGIVFPELSMSREEFGSLAEALVTVDRFLIAGVGSPAKSSGRGHQCGTNEALLSVGVRLQNGPEFRTEFTQKKHHRWKLTKPQIRQYGLASNLHPGADWWEHIAVENRSISFVALRPWLTMSVLICEDLARPDPVGDLIRAVGPNLIIALLCDAPQLIGRWPGRYAGALADDPGSSVLTLTSIGASNLSKPLTAGINRNRTVALWRDSKSGATEIELPEGASALLLNISVEYHEEWTADGRGDTRKGSYPVLSGVHPIYLKHEGA